MKGKGAPGLGGWKTLDSISEGKGAPKPSGPPGTEDRKRNRGFRWRAPRGDRGPAWWRACHPEGFTRARVCDTLLCPRPTLGALHISTSVSLT